MLSSGLQTAKRSFTFATEEKKVVYDKVVYVSKPLSGRSLLQGEEKGS